MSRESVLGYSLRRSIHGCDSEGCKNCPEAIITFSETINQVPQANFVELWCSTNCLGLYCQIIQIKDVNGNIIETPQPKFPGNNNLPELVGKRLVNCTHPDNNQKDN